ALLPQQDRDGGPGGRPARSHHADAGARAPRGARHAAEAAVPGRHRDRRVRPGLLLGRRARLLDRARRVHDGRGLRGRHDAEPDVRGDVQRADRPHRGGPRRVRPRADLVRAAAQALLGGPRPDHGQPPGQRRRHPVPLGAVLDDRRPARGRRGVPRRVRRAPEGRGQGPDHDRAGPRRRVLLRRGLPPAVPAQGPERLLRPRRHRRRLSHRHRRL
ncbi:MAG: Peptide-methionine (S)-S-oxide reductase MsrA, partial [uncultured Thermoleophilia bacterium]